MLDRTHFSKISMSVPFFCLIYTFDSFLFVVWAVYCVFNCGRFLNMLGLTNQPKGREFDSDEDEETASQRYLKQVPYLFLEVWSSTKWHFNNSRSYFIVICFCDALVICTLSGSNQQIVKFVKTHTGWNLVNVAADQIFIWDIVGWGEWWFFSLMNPSWEPNLEYWPLPS